MDSPQNTSPKGTDVTNEELSDWAFVTVMTEHLRTCLREGRFSQVQTMIREQGFTLGIYNTEKHKARKGR